VREIPAGLVSIGAAKLFVTLNCIAFIVCTYFINALCFYLSPIALIIILGYSYTKRFTSLCHFVLGLGLGLAPIGAFIAVTNQFYMLPILYGTVVFLWVAGFDIIYALQDEDFDQQHQLNSVPSLLGKDNARKVSIIVHFLAAFTLIYSTYLASSLYTSLGMLHWSGTTIFVGLLIYQHIVIHRSGLQKIGLAFFTTNGIASVLFGVLFIVDIIHQ